MNNSKIGILLVSFGYQYEKITPQLVDSIRKFSNIPILIHTNINSEFSSVDYSGYDNLELVYHKLNDDENRYIKTRLSKYTKYEKTLYIDVDSVILSKEFLKPFEYLESFDICCPVNYDNLTLENFKTKFSKNSGFDVFYRKIMENKNIIPENFFILGGGVCYFKKNKLVDTFFNDFFYDWIIEKKRDMPSLMFSYYKNKNNLKLKTLSTKEYNGGASTIIKSLHQADIVHKQLTNDFIRRKFNSETNNWEYYKQGQKNFIKIPKIAFVYDVYGWAFFIIANNLKKNLNQYYDIDVVSCKNVKQKNYDVIVTFSPTVLPTDLNKNNLIVGVSSHKNIKHIKPYNFVFTNDKNIFSTINNNFKYYAPNGVDTNFFNGHERNLQNKTLRIGLVGSLSRNDHKGSNRIDIICSKLKKLGFDVKNEKIIVDTGDVKKIITQGDMKKYYNNIDLFLISSISETGPNPLLESMSMGVPVIANKVGLVNSLIINGENGIIINDYNDTDGYVNAIIKLINNKDLYSKISKNSIKTIKEFDWNIKSLNYKNIIDNFILYNKNGKTLPNIKSEISIIIPTYNNIEYLGESLNSIINSGKNHNIEILVGIDGCEKTLNYVKQKTYPDFVKFHYFNSNNGPYDIKNTLTKISNSEKIIFFDSDDIMTDTTIDEVVVNLGRYDLVRLKYKEIRDNRTSDKTNFHEGAIGINKTLFLSMNGFEPWMCAADSDFLGRIYKRKPRIYHTKNLSMYYRRHNTSLTLKKETGMASPLRATYAKTSKNKKGDGNPNKLYTRDFVIVDVNTIVVDTKNHEYYNHRKSQLDKVLNPVPRKVVGQQTKKKDPVINDRTDLLYTNPKPLVRTIKPNKPDNRQDLINLKNNTNKSVHKQLFNTKPERRTGINPITIGGKSKM
jgi:glycosyltransferase involved in cell wall biosynthesis